MPRKTQYTQITPIPLHIPRQLAIDMLHSHGEVIELNPLVTGHRPIPTPRDSPADEYFAQWHEINEIITWGFGMKKKITFRGVFHDMPWGLQTHTYAPFGVDLRNKWQVRGNQPGEPREPKELGVDVPSEGLYLREDVEIACNAAITSFVKKEMKAAARVMVERMKRKAELLDEGVLQAMFEGGKLKTINPAQQAHLNNAQMAMQSADTPNHSSLPASPPNSPPLSDKSLESGGGRYGNYHDVARHQSGRVTSFVAALPRPQSDDLLQSSRRESQYSDSQLSASQLAVPEPHKYVAEVDGNYYHPQAIEHSVNVPQVSSNVGFAIELPGDTGYLAPRPLSVAQNGNTNGGSHQDPVTAVQTQPPYRNSYGGVSHPSPSLGQSQRDSVSQASNSPRPSPAPAQAPYPQPAGTSSAYYPYNPAEYAARNRVSSSSQQNYVPYAQATPEVSASNRFATAGLRDSLPQPATNAPIAQPQTSFSSDASNQRISVGSYAEGDDAHTGALRSRPQSAAPPPASNVWCPVCRDFQGDEAAVSHHVSTHFS